MRQNCYQCLRAKSVCICQSLSPIETNIHFAILTHPMERQKVKNGTGRMTYLQLQNASLITDTAFENNNEVNTLLDKYESYLLYPGEGCLNISTMSDSPFEFQKPICIFILDATWPCAKKMLKLSPNLQKLARISFDHSIKSEFIIKQQPHELCLGTIESTKVLLDELNRLGVESVNTDNFLNPFRKMIELQVECIKNPHNNVHHHVRKRSITPKTMYKKENSRRLFFNSDILRK